MQQLRQLTEHAMSKDPAVAASLLGISTKSATLEQGKEKSWVQSTPRDQNCRQTRSMGTITQQAPRVTMQASPRVEKPSAGRAEAPPSSKTAKKRRKRRAAMRLAATADAPARNTRAQMKQAAEPASSRTRKSTKAQTRMARLMRPTVLSTSKA